MDSANAKQTCLCALPMSSIALVNAKRERGRKKHIDGCKRRLLIDCFLLYLSAGGAVWLHLHSNLSDQPQYCGLSQVAEILLWLDLAFEGSSCSRANVIGHHYMVVHRLYCLLNSASELMQCYKDHKGIIRQTSNIVFVALKPFCP